MSGISSDVRIELPIIPLTTDPILHQELMKVYEAIRTLQLELSSAKARIKQLENYNISNP